MIHMNQVKVPVEDIIKVAPADDIKRGTISEEELELVYQAAAKKLRIVRRKIHNLFIIRKSMDARKRQKICFSYQVELQVEKEKELIKRFEKKNVLCLPEGGPGECMRDTYRDRVNEPFAIGRKKQLSPIVVGFGPAGMFAALTLARAGYAPHVVERGQQVEIRQREVDKFWKTGKLHPECNVQFGEGGAGTFSDGKLNTLVKERSGSRHRRILHDFVSFGAPVEILYLQKPHIGTDILKDVVKNIRKEIIRLGGRFSFGTRFVDYEAGSGRLDAVVLERDGKRWEEPCRQLILATGHSARDTFYRLHEKGLYMEPKSFAVGVRVEHPQEMIGSNQYGKYHDVLPAASYQLTHRTESGRSVYSFCMCPGGYVVNASSEEGRLAINGMSYYDRAGDNANSAIVVSVTPEDFGETGVLAGIAFQRKYEELAYRQAAGKIPLQLFGDFVQNKQSTTFGGFLPSIKGQYALSNVREILPGVVGDAIVEGMGAFGERIRGFDREDAILSGIESRTSSPVRIVRNQLLQANVQGIYPCGEGAGYAGGIVSAAIDGLRIAEAVMEGEE